MSDDVVKTWIREVPPTWNETILPMKKKREIRCGTCRWYSKGECCYNPPTPVVSPIHGVIGIRPLTDPEDFCAFYSTRED